MSDANEKLAEQNKQMEKIGEDRKSVDNKRYGLAEQLMRLGTE